MTHEENNTHIEIIVKRRLALQTIQICLSRSWENAQPLDKRRSKDREENFTRGVTPSNVAMLHKTH